MGELSKLPNIGTVVEKLLNEVGIETVDELEELGSKKAFLRIRMIDSSACINMLCGLEGAIRRIRWHNLDEGTKKDLKVFIKGL